MNDLRCMDEGTLPKNTSIGGQRVHKSILERIELLNNSFKAHGVTIGTVGLDLGPAERSSDLLSTVKMIKGIANADETGDCCSVAQLSERAPVYTLAPENIPDCEEPDNRLSIWEVGSGVTLIGQCWNNKTEPFSNKNNIKEMNDYLESSYGKEYMVYSFTPDHKGNKFNRFQFYEINGFSISKLLEIAKTAKCWIDLHQNGRIIVEARQDKGKLVMLVLCTILAYTKEMPSAEAAFRSLGRNPNFPLPASEAVLRYTKYFDQLFNIRPAWKAQELLLNQIILTVPANRLLSENHRPVWIIKDGRGVKEIAENYYRDDNFVVFSIMNMMLQGDIELCLCSTDGKSQQLLFSLSINTFFYKAGLYRFRYAEVEPSAVILKEAEWLAGDNLLIDLIFTDSREVEHQSLYILEQNLIHDLKTLKDHIPREVPKEKLKIFISNSFNEIISSFCALMDYTLEEGSDLVKRLETHGYRNLIYQANPIQVPQVEDTSKSISVSSEKEKLFISTEEGQIPLVLSRDGCFTIVPLDPITDVVVQKATGASVGLKARFKKKAAAEKSEPPELVAFQPLHWVALTDIEETIFNDIKELEADIDHARFEELFCEALASRGESKLKVSSAKHGAIGDQRRLFLVSLSIRHLELKGITPTALAGIIHDRPETLSLQELLNIERIIPSEQELSALESEDVSSLNDAERCMCEYLKIIDLEKKVKLLIFERRFCDEMALNKQNLIDILSLLNEILDSKELRMVLKVILNIGNAINYRYSVRRKLASGYRLEALNMLCSYSGKHGTTLFDFMVDSLKRYEINLGCLADDLKLVHMIKNVDLASIKEKVNWQIICYNDQLAAYEAFDEKNQRRYRHIMGSACKILMEVSQIYKECGIHCSVVKRKFGENDLKPINEIFETISSFIKRIERNFSCSETGL